MVGPGGEEASGCTAVVVEEGAVTAPRAAPPATIAVTSASAAHGTTFLGIRCTFRPLRTPLPINIVSDVNPHRKEISIDNVVPGRSLTHGAQACQTAPPRRGGPIDWRRRVSYRGRKTSDHMQVKFRVEFCPGGDTTWTRSELPAVIGRNWFDQLVAEGPHCPTAWMREGLPTQSAFSSHVHQLTTFIGDAAISLKADFLRDSERWCIPIPDRGPESAPSRRKGRFGHSVGSLRGVPMSVEEAEQFTGQFWLIKRVPTADQSAVPDRVALDRRRMVSRPNPFTRADSFCSWRRRQTSSKVIVVPLSCSPSSSRFHAVSSRVRNRRFSRAVTSQNDMARWRSVITIDQV